MVKITEKDFVDLRKINPSIRLDMRYARRQHFLKKTLEYCFLRKAVAEKLSVAQKMLEKLHLSLKVYEGYRPEKAIYNRGCSVDVTLVDKKGKELIMPTFYGEVGPRTSRSYQFLPKQVLYNRYLLENVMKACGFRADPEKWWHFEDEEKEQYPVEDISFENLLGNK